jgi:hypothetical protein
MDNYKERNTTMQTAHFFIKEEHGDTYASLMHKAITLLENEIYFPAIIEIKPEFQAKGLWITVTFNDK